MWGLVGTSHLIQSNHARLIRSVKTCVVVIPAIGIMIGFYIFTRLLSVLTRSGERKEHVVVQVVAALALLVTAFVVCDLVIEGLPKTVFSIVPPSDATVEHIQPAPPSPLPLRPLPPPSIGQLDESGKVAIVEKTFQGLNRCDYISAVDPSGCASGVGPRQCMATKVAAAGGNLLFLDGENGMAYRCK